ncbi:MAG: DUF1553 domain-containing protein [Planctomycetota bacterium]|nr:DUF1553 domain-containing protein [Planctomycetota bacterium]
MAAEVDYLAQIKPLLQKHCYACHGALRQRGGLRLDTVVLANRGGESGPAVVGGNLAESLAYQAVTGQAGFEMPPKSEGIPLTEAEMTLLRRWIEEGARGVDDETPEQDPRKFWSYLVPQRPLLPAAGAATFDNPVDRFLQAQREQHGLTPRPAAPPAVLLRRLYLDLIGLPPTRSELRRFLADPSETAYDQIVDALLVRPEYGERWGRHWMDVWRYSDWYGSNNEIRYGRRGIWRWRDWIVDSLNEDKPYDRMVMEMLAGDELAPGDRGVVRATGYLGRSWYKFDRNVWMFDTVEHAGQAFLGLTLRCCRCHDHKYDPIAQVDYYRFRAFFEPHDLLTEQVPGAPERVKDTKYGQVLKNGLARAYDKNPSAPTYRFLRGDGRYPDKEHPLAPGVPPALGGGAVEVRDIELPLTAFYPALRDDSVDETLAVTKSNVAAASQTVMAAERKHGVAVAAVASAVSDGLAEDSSQQEPFMKETFDGGAAERWQIKSGEWRFGQGTLTQSRVTRFATAVSKVTHPRDFFARVRYLTLKPGGLRSVGFSYDYRDEGGSSHDIYTSTNDTSTSIQAFHRKNGRHFYPLAGVVRTPITLGEETTVEIEVRGLALTIWLNGEKKLEYQLPEPRAEGRFSLWVHEGAAEFREVTIRSLRATVADLRRVAADAGHAVSVARLQLKIAQHEHASLQRRIAAERIKYGATPNKEEMAQSAAAAERGESAVQVARAELGLLQARRKGALLTETRRPTQPAEQQDVERKILAAEKEMAAAQARAGRVTGKYTPLGTVYPRRSTGRRLALARWIGNRQNPRTARIAVNHLWLRHFGGALVSSVANLGLNGIPPTHPRLLDWLAVEFMEGDWRMKRMHRLLVRSRSYRMASTAGQMAGANRQVDPDNRFLWRMNSRRAEAETVRDSLLAVCGSLDSTMGGPEIAETSGEEIYRRSLYFRLTPNEKMKMLEVFDVADPNACYRRQISVIPQQALALSNSRLALEQSQMLADRLRTQHPDPVGLVQAGFEIVLSRPVGTTELDRCLEFLSTQTGALRQAGVADAERRAAGNLIHVLLNHNDFVTIR